MNVRVCDVVVVCVSYHASRVAIIIFSKSERLIALSGEVENASSISIICRQPSCQLYNGRVSGRTSPGFNFSLSTAAAAFTSRTPRRLRLASSSGTPGKKSKNARKHSRRCRGVISPFVLGNGGDIRRADDDRVFLARVIRVAPEPEPPAVAAVAADLRGRFCDPA
jgi:hypothetical protein